MIAKGHLRLFLGDGSLIVFRRFQPISHLRLTKREDGWEGGIYFFHKKLRHKNHVE
jgi:hypothetical protein